MQAEARNRRPEPGCRWRTCTGHRRCHSAVAQRKRCQPADCCSGSHQEAAPLAQPQHPDRRRRRPPTTCHPGRQMSRRPSLPRQPRFEVSADRSAPRQRDDSCGRQPGTGRRIGQCREGSRVTATSVRWRMQTDRSESGLQRRPIPYVCVDSPEYKSNSSDQPPGSLGRTRCHRLPA